MTLDIQSPTAAAPLTERSFREEALAIAAYIASLEARKRNGDIAELRRIGANIPPAIFWTLVEHTRVPQHHEVFWQAAVGLMCIAPHRRGAIPGRVMHDARVSPSRIERWLRLDGQTAIREARKLLRRLDGLDWGQFGPLLWYWDREPGDQMRRDFARSFFLSK